MSARVVGMNFGLGLLVLAMSLASAAAWSGRVAALDQGSRRVAVSAFHVPDGARARQAVLAVLSEHGEVDVVSLDDIAAASARLDADPNEPAGRAKLSRELRIAGWLEAETDSGTLMFSLRAPDGRLLARCNLSEGESSAVASVAGSRVWSSIGPWLSSREQAQRYLAAQLAVGQAKQAARARELQRLQQVMQRGALERIAQLTAAQALAKAKRAAYAAELARQRAIARERSVSERRNHYAGDRAFVATLRGQKPARQ